MSTATASTAAPWARERQELRAEVLALMARWPEVAPEPSHVDALLLRLFRLQAQAIAPYAKLVASRGIDPSGVSTLDQVPLVPVAAFKYAPFALELPGGPATRFATSGTSDGQPGHVDLPDTAAYDWALQQTFAHFVVPDAALAQRPHTFRCLSLVPTAAARPNSSLGYMVRRLAQRWDDGGGGEFLGTPNGGDDGLDIAGFVAACRQAQRDGVPVLLFATTLALDILLQRWPAGQRIRLPAGSRLMDTGGPKGRRLHVSRAEQHRQLVDAVGLQPAMLVGELGMTELASQRYEGQVRRHLGLQVVNSDGYLSPPWLRTAILEPRSGRRQDPGQVGLVAHLDLANLDTAAFVLTADLGHCDAAGGLHLAGRLPGSEWRGCGLDAEELTGIVG